MENVESELPRNVRAKIELTRLYRSWKLVPGPSSARQDPGISDEIHRVSVFKLRSFNFTLSLRGVLQVGYRAFVSVHYRRTSSCSSQRLRSSRTVRVAVIEKLRTLFRATGTASLLLRRIIHKTRFRANSIRQWNTYISRGGYDLFLSDDAANDLYTYRNRDRLWAMIRWWDGLQAIASSVIRDDVISTRCIAFFFVNHSVRRSRHWIVLF